MKTGSNSCHGFSLVELAIALVIIGLLAGGVLTGQSLIRAAKIRSVLSEQNTYLTAINSFLLQYDALPGDMPNATRFWGTHTAVPEPGFSLTCANATTHATGSETCDGNGDGAIDLGVSTFHEKHRAWQHMKNAGLIDGSFTGIASGGSIFLGQFGVTAGLNAPQSSIEGAGFSLGAFNTASATHSRLYSGRYGNVMFFGKTSFPSGGSASNAELPVLAPEEAWNIDRKIDDGTPAEGKMRTYHTNTNCVTSDDRETAEYNLKHTQEACAYFVNIE